jgi:O-antigen/teichoic acid export membrane protein
MVGYGVSRTAVEGLLAARGLLLAGILGPELFGVWALFRIGIRYLGFAGLGMLRGLEFEASRATGRSAGGVSERTVWGQVAAGHTLLLYGALSVLAAIAWFWASTKTLAGMALLGIAMGLLLDRFWIYGIAFLRVSSGLKRFAVLEFLHAGIQITACVLLAQHWGLPGAFAGFAMANLVGIILLARRAPLRPRFQLARVGRLVRIGFPVALLGILTATLATVDRLLVGAFLGIGGLGVYAFAVSVSEVGVSIAGVVRTVILKDVYGRRDSSDGRGADPSLLENMLLVFATVGPVLVGIFALLLPLLIDRLAGAYLLASPVAQLLLFAGLIQGVSNVAVLGLVAEGRQSRLLPLSIAAVCLNVCLALGALSFGFGLRGVAIAALLTRLTQCAAIIRLLAGPHGTLGFGGVIVRFLAPSIWCAAAVYAITYFLPVENMRSLGLQLLLYGVAVSVLSPAILQVLTRPRSRRDS